MEVGYLSLPEGTHLQFQPSKGQGKKIASSRKVWTIKEDYFERNGVWEDALVMVLVTSQVLSRLNEEEH